MKNTDEICFYLKGEERLRGNYDDGPARASTWTCRCTKLVSSIFNIRLSPDDNNYGTGSLTDLIPGGSTWWPLSVESFFSSPSFSSWQRLTHQNIDKAHSWMLQLGFFKRKRPEEADDVDFMVSANFEKVRLSDDLWSKWCQPVNSWHRLRKLNGDICEGPTGKSHHTR